MKLHQLSLSYFGPYTNVTVNFDDFENVPVFLITGQTGSGKTTLFDGLIYALYGETSSPERSGEALRAQFATPEDVTSVRLSFSHAGRDYLVVRQPLQELAKKRGTGTKMAAADVSLTVYENGVEQQQLLKVRDVNEYIKDLLRLDATQFRQMVLLPQGQFRQFLDASSKAKAELLRHLFNTGLYDKWQDGLNQLLKQKRQQSERQQTAMLEQLQLVQSEEPLDEQQPVADQMVQLQAVVDQQRSQEQEAKQALTAAQKAATQATTAWQAGKQLAELYAQAAQAQATLDRLAADKPHQQALHQQLTLLRQAQQLQPLLKEESRAADQVTALTRQLEATRSLLGIAKSSEADTTKQQQQLRRKLPQIEEARSQVTRLTATKQQLQQLAATQEQLAQAKAQLVAQQQRQTQLVETADQKQAQVTTLTATIAALQAQVEAKQATLQDHQTQVASLLPLQTKVTTLTASLKALDGQAAGLAKQVAAAQQTSAVTIKRRLQLQSDWAAHQIAELASQLLPDAPCPVCGSTAHPHPATTTLTTEPVTQEALERATDEAQRAGAALATAQAQLDQHQRQQAQQQAQLAELQDSLAAQLATIGWSGDAAAFIAAGSQLQSTLAATQAELQANRKQLGALQEALLTLTTAKEAGQTQLQVDQQTVVQLEAKQAAQSEALPEGVSDLAQLETQLTELQSQIEQYATSDRQLQSALTVLHDRRVELEATLLAQEKNKQSADDRLAAATAAFEAATDMARTTLAELLADLPKLPAIEAALTAANAAEVAARTTHENVTAAIANRPQPDLPQLEQAARTAEAVVAEAQATAATAHQLVTHNQTVLQRVTATWEENQVALREQQGLSQLSGVVAGDNPAKLSLERYVLQTYLAKVLQEANGRLNRLSQGRYQFVLDQTPGSRPSDTGLEISVYDDQVGATRSVHTLSGGESFIAALSLALALGEVIQQENGGVTIDALFVDEGFGSLDTASLNTALEALETLEGKNRLVGIISHVTELKDGIQDQLQVLPKGDGTSTIKVKLSTLN